MQAPPGEKQLTVIYRLQGEVRFLPPPFPINPTIALPEKGFGSQSGFGPQRGFGGHRPEVQNTTESLGTSRGT